MTSNESITSANKGNGRHIPKHWQWVKFGDVVTDVNKSEKNPLTAGLKRYIGLEHIEPENLHVSQWGNLEDDEVSFKKVFRQGQVLFGKRRAYQRKVALAEFDGICSSDILTFEPKDESRLSSQLLPFIVQSNAFFDYALGTSSGSLSPRTRWSQLKDFEFPLPNAEQQKRICGVLVAARMVADYNFQVMGDTRDVRNAALRQLRTSTKFERVQVGEIAKFTSGNSIRVSDLDQSSSESPIPVFGGNGISGYTNEEMSVIDKRVVVVGRVGQYCGCVIMAEPPCWVTDNALFSVDLKDGCDPDFLGLTLEASRLNRLKLGNYLPLINQKVLHSWKIPFPTLGDQQRILRIDRVMKIALEKATVHWQKSKQLLESLREELLNPISKSE